MEDTLITVKRYEAARYKANYTLSQLQKVVFNFSNKFLLRIEYDAYRHEYETLLQSGTAQCSALAEAQKAHDDQKVEFGIVFSALYFQS